MSNRSLAAVVSQPGREACLERVLRSLRPQVDVLCCYWNGPSSQLPDFIAGLVDEVKIDKGNEAGDTGNLYWSNKTTCSLYLSCDDDLEYAPQYRDIMSTWVEYWQGHALCTLHGLQFRPGTSHWKQRVVYQPPVGTHVRIKGKDWHGGTAKLRILWKLGWVHQVRWDQPTLHHSWIHQPGSGVMAWNPKVLQVPPSLPEKNNADLLIALWAYQNRIPVCAIPHGAWEVKDILPEGIPSIWTQHREDGFIRRNQLITEANWRKTYAISDEGVAYVLDTPLEPLARPTYQPASTA